MKPATHYARLQMTKAGNAWKPSRLRMFDLVRWQARARLNNKEMAELMRVHRVTYSRWVNEHQMVPRWVADWLTHVAPRLPLEKPVTITKT